MFYFSGVRPRACDGVIWNQKANLPSFFATGTHHMEALVSYKANRYSKKFLGPVWESGERDCQKQS